MKPFDKLIELIKGMTVDEIIKEVEAYPECGECDDCREKDSPCLPTINGVKK